MQKRDLGNSIMCSRARAARPHMSTELFMRQAGIKLTAVSYRGIPPALVDFINGQLHVGFFPVGQIAPHVESGKARVLAVAAPTRVRQFPEVPTMLEIGFAPSQVVRPWFTFLVPKRTPGTVVDRLHASIARALVSPEVRRRSRDSATLQFLQIPRRASTSFWLTSSDVGESSSQRRD